MTALDSIGGEPVNGGWIPSTDQEIASAYASGLYRDHEVGEDVPEMKGDKVFLWEATKIVFGGYFLNWQMIGSCVNGGGQNGLIARIALEALHGPKHEAAVIPFTLLPYAHSRSTYIGQPNRSEGDGASATGFAEMLDKIGTPPSNLPGLPQPKLIPIKGRDDAKCIVYSPGSLAEIARFDPRTMSPRIVALYELQFSTARNLKPEWNEAAKKHNLQYVRCRSAEDVKRELRRGRPVLAAGDWGGRMQCSYKGEPRVLFNQESGSWAHQQSILGYWNHPTLGDIFYWMNQWYGLNGEYAVSVHGETTNGEPPGGYWTAAKDVDYQARTGEVFSLHSFNGYPGDIDWKLGV